VTSPQELLVSREGPPPESGGEGILPGWVLSALVLMFIAAAFALGVVLLRSRNR
jgi:hypothetical protein